MMGSGKSTVGRALGQRLGWRLLDLDDVVAHRIGCSIAEFWVAHGEEAFRDVEAAVVRDAAGESRCVVATGGGVVIRDDNVTTMRASGLVVWLQARPETLARRAGSGEKRPLLHGGESLATLHDLLAARSTAYAGAAHVHVATDEAPIETVVDRVEELWNEFE